MQFMFLLRSADFSLSIAESRLAALLSPAPNGAATSELHMSGNAFGRFVVSFQWQEVLLFEGSCTASDAVYEMASAVVSMAVWKQQQAKRLAEAGQAGTTSEAAIKVCLMPDTCAAWLQFIFYGAS